MKKIQGFTLIELMVTIAVLAIIAMMAAPTFNSLTRNNQLTTDARDLVAELLQVRSDAVVRQKEQTLTLSGSSVAWKPSDSVVWSAGQPAQAAITYNMMGYLKSSTNLCLSLEHVKDSALVAIILVRRNGAVFYDKSLTVCPSNLGNE